MNKFWHDIKLIITVFFLMVSSVAITLWVVRETQGFNAIPSSVPVPVTLAGPGRIMRVSAYCPCEKCCGVFADGYTASGKPAVGLIVAAPPDISFGTVLRVYGPLTRAAHEAAVGDQYAKELMVWEVK